MKGGQVVCTTSKTEDGGGELSVCLCVCAREDVSLCRSSCQAIGGVSIGSVSENDIETENSRGFLCVRCSVWSGHIDTRLIGIFMILLTRTRAHFHTHSHIDNFFVRNANTYTGRRERSGCTHGGK